MKMGLGRIQHYVDSINEHIYDWDPIFHILYKVKYIYIYKHIKKKKEIKKEKELIKDVELGGKKEEEKLCNLRSLRGARIEAIRLNYHHVQGQVLLGKVDLKNASMSSLLGTSKN